MEWSGRPALTKYLAMSYLPTVGFHRQHLTNVATLVGRPWGMDMVDEGVARPFKPWDLEATDYPANASKRPCLCVSYTYFQAIR